MSNIYVEQRDKNENRDARRIFKQFMKSYEHLSAQDKVEVLDWGLCVLAAMEKRRDTHA